ncbi:MAG: hypothetical protein AAGC74_07825 [Verrucomicrobiota bacterium]
MRDAPLVEAVLVLGVMAFFAWPLAQVTGRERGRVEQEMVAEDATEFRADVEVEGTSDLLWVELEREGESLGRIEEREGEFEVEVNPLGERWVVRGEFGEGKAGAVRIEVAPDYHESLEKTLWGEGTFEGFLKFNWDE